MWNIQEFEELDSTNNYARSLINSGKAQDRDVIQAYHQTKGRGRLLERTWVDEPAASLLISLILKQTPVASAEFTQYLVGLTVLRAVRALVNTEAHRVLLKWPNDILIDGSKVSGSMSEAVWSNDQLKGLVIGIGVNVNQKQFPPEIAQKATSLSLTTGKDFDLKTVRDTLLACFDVSLSIVQSFGDDNLKQLWILTEIRREMEWMRELEGIHIMSKGLYGAPSWKYEGVSDGGKLLLKNTENETIEFDTADIQLAYKFNNE